MSRLIVGYSLSAVLPRDLVTGLAWCSSVLFVVRPGSPARTVPPLLADLGDVLEIDGEIPWEELRAFGADGIVTFSEDLLGLVAEISDGLGLRFASPEVVEALRDKRVQRRRLKEAGVEETRVAAVESLDQWKQALREVGLPLVVKPARGAGSSATVLVRDEAAGRRHVEAQLSAHPDRPLIVEEYLQDVAHEVLGSYVSVESLVQDGVVSHLGVTGKLPLLPPFRETGQFAPAALPAYERDAVADLAERAIAALGLRDGVTHTEVKLTPSGPRLIEVNGRLGGYINELYSRYLGSDVIELVTRAACGEKVVVPDPARNDLCFQYTHQPPVQARILAAVDGSRQVSRHPAVSRYERLLPPGAELPQDHSTTDLDLLCGAVPGLDALPSTLSEIRGLLTFSFDAEDGPLVLRGSQLG